MHPRADVALRRGWRNVDVDAPIMSSPDLCLPQHRDAGEGATGPRGEQ